MKTIAQEIAELRELTVPELVERFRELYGREPRVNDGRLGYATDALGDDHRASHYCAAIASCVRCQ